MTGPQRLILFDALMGKIDPKSKAWDVLAELANEDINAIEPIIDAIVDEEIKRRIA